MQSRSGCWTCKLRRKRCSDVTGPEQAKCSNCETLRISCYRGLKPTWMDGGRQQAEIAAQFKHEVRMNSHLRLVQQDGHGRVTVDTGKESSSTFAAPPRQESRLNGRDKTNCKWAQTSALISSNSFIGIPTESESMLLSYYLDIVVPFLLPMYCPNLKREGGRAWILELTSSSPIFRQLAVWQSSYYFAYNQGTTDDGWGTILQQTEHVFDMLRHAIGTMAHSSVKSHLHGAVRILACIMQIQRFEIALMSFTNCRYHLNAAIGLFKEILAVVDEQPGVEQSRFFAISGILGPPANLLGIQFPNSEQAALRLSTSLLLFDDVIASTVLRETPRLYAHHEALLIEGGETHESLDLADAVGCPNWVLIELGKAAALDAWKLRCQDAGSLDALDLGYRVITIRQALLQRLSHLEVPFHFRDENQVLGKLQMTKPIAQREIVSRIWAHAALVYLLTVSSGWQPANSEIRFHVRETIELLHQLAPPQTIRALSWPFYIVGSLADDAQMPLIRQLVATLHPRGGFGVIAKALEVIELIWKGRGHANRIIDDYTAFVRSSDDLILLV